MFVFFACVFLFLFAAAFVVRRLFKIIIVKDQSLTIMILKIQASQKKRHTQNKHTGQEHKHKNKKTKPPKGNPNACQLGSASLIPQVRKGVNLNPQRTEMITVMGAIFGSTACA